MRRTLVAAAAILLVLALAGPAEAKGAIPRSARMTGPGLAKAMTFGDPTSASGTSADGNIVLLANETRFFETLYEGSRTSAPAAATLGPRYTIVWKMRRPRRAKTFEVRSELYPYAKGGPVMHTRGGQKIREGNSTFVLRSGWARANPVIVENLQAWGMPRQNPPRAEHKVTTSAVAPWWAIPFGLVALIVVAVVRMKRSAGAPPPA